MEKLSKYPELEARFVYGMREYYTFFEPGFTASQGVDKLVRDDKAMSYTVSLYHCGPAIILSGLDRREIETLSSQLVFFVGEDGAIEMTSVHLKKLLPYWVKEQEAFTIGDMVAISVPRNELEYFATDVYDVENDRLVLIRRMLPADRVVLKSPGRVGYSSRIP